MNIKKGFFETQVFHIYSFPFLAQIQRTALQQIHYKISLVIHIDCVLDIHRIAVDPFQCFQDFLHQTGEYFFFQQFLAADEPYISVPSHLIESVFRIIIMFQYLFLYQRGNTGSSFSMGTSVSLFS